MLLNSKNFLFTFFISINSLLGPLAFAKDTKNIISVSPLSSGEILFTNKPARSFVIEGLLPPKELGAGPQSLQYIYSPQMGGGDLLIDDFPTPLPPVNNGPNGNWKAPPTRQGSSFSNSGNPSFDLALNVPEEFQCSLFENPDTSSMLSAIQSLNQAINSPLCQKDAINKEAVLANTQKIMETIKALKAQMKSVKESPQNASPEAAAESSQRVDSAILAAIDLANTFSQQSLFQESCQPASGGHIALAINDLLNGLTPYALMAVTSTGVGTAALPYLFGGQAIIGAISNLNQNFTQKNLNLDDQNIRKAILENTCQYIKLTQRNQFMLYERGKQVYEISKNINESVAFFNSAADSLPNDLHNKFKSYEKKEALISSIQKEADQEFNTLSNIKSSLQNLNDPNSVCSLGKQFLNEKSRSSITLPYAVMNTLQKVMQFHSLSMQSPAFAVIDVHQRMSSELGTLVQKNGYLTNQEILSCSQMTHTWINATENALNLITQITKEEQEALNKETQQDPDYITYKDMEQKIVKKKQMADKVILAMDKLKDFSTVFTRSDLNDELSRLRKGLLTGGQASVWGYNLPLLPGAKAPVLQWMDYKFEKYQQKIAEFLKGLKTLRRISSNVMQDNNLHYKNLSVRVKAAQNLWPFSLKYLKLETTEHKTVCRELRMTWYNYVSAVDHLASSELFCAMLEPIIYDQNNVDAKIISVCQGKVKPNSNGREPSQINAYKNMLINNKTKDWALYIWKLINDLQCPATAIN